MTSNVRGVSGARQARYAEAILHIEHRRALLADVDLPGHYARAVMAVADEELAESRAEVERLRGPFRCCPHCVDDPEYHAENPKHSHDVDCVTCGRESDRRADAAEAETRALRERLTALADLIERHTEREQDRVEFRHADTGVWHGVATFLRAALAASPAVDATPEPTPADSTTHTCMALREGRTCDLASGHAGDHQNQTVRGMRTWSDQDHAGTETTSDEPSVGPAREGDCDSVPACTCGSPDAYSLNPTEVVVHRSEGPCFIAPLDGPTPAAEPQAEGGA